MSSQVDAGEVRRLYAEGYCLIPCNLDKRPAISEWRPFQQERPTEDQMGRWIKVKHAAWALITGAISGVIVLDFDGTKGVETMRKLGLSPHVKTGSGGYHVYFVHPGWAVSTVNSKSKKKLGEFYPGMDIRADGGYAVCLGRNESGPYEFLRPLEPELLDILPTDVLQFLGLDQPPSEAQPLEIPTNGEGLIVPTAEHSTASAMTLLGIALKRAPKEGRNNTGLWLSVALRDNGFPEDEAQSTIETYHQAVPSEDQHGRQDPYTLDEALATLKQAYSRDPRPRVDTTEGGLADAFIESQGKIIRYTDESKQWRRWDGKLWQKDLTVQIYDMTRRTCQAASKSIPKEKRTLKAAKTVAAVLKMASADQRITMINNDWDSNKWLLNTPGGIVNLHTGELMGHEPTCYITKTTAVGPGGNCPIWIKQLEFVTGGDMEFGDYLQRWAGYSLTGETSEEALAFYYGMGANGKGTFVDTIQRILKDYSRAASMQTFMASRNEQHPVDLADLCGARMVIASEVDETSRWNSERIKRLTGGDMIKARFMHCNPFEYYPEYKIWIEGNHQPTLYRVDDAWRRRLHLIPFTQKIEDIDQDFKNKLKPEYGGILSWAIEGCLKWIKQRLVKPAVVARATDSYFEVQDVLDHWIQERCQKSTGKTSSSDLFQDWKFWAEKNMEYVGSHKSFTQSLDEKGFKRIKSHGTVYLTGISLGNSNEIYGENETEETLYQ